MDSIKLLARNGEAVRHALELGEILHMDTASEELTDEFLLFAIRSGLLKTWAEGFPDPRQWSAGQPGGHPRRQSRGTFCQALQLTQDRVCPAFGPRLG